jgi:hypothetical protein
MIKSENLMNERVWSSPVAPKLGVTHAKLHVQCANCIPRRVLVSSRFY